MTRSLRLRKETLAPLTDDELGGLAGGTSYTPQEFRVLTREKCSFTYFEYTCQTLWDVPTIKC